MKSIATTNAARKRRHKRVRKNLFGTSSRLRLCVFRSLNHIYVQVIDDKAGNTILSASTLDVDVKSDLENKTKKEQAEVVGTLIAQRAKSSGIEQVVFDRGGYKYHGRIKSLADGARAAGLRF